MMQFRRYVAVAGLVGALSMAAPVAHAAPAPQQPAAPVVSSGLEAAMAQGILEVFPAESFQQVQPRFLPLQSNLYLLSHPALYWPVEQEPAAQALAGELAERAPGWGTTVSDGPQGYGVYLTYQHNG
jgi:hypothetical protein